MVKVSGESSTSRACKAASPSNKTKQNTLSIAEILKKIRGRGNRKPEASVKYFNNINPQYGWLPDNWIAEERRTPSGRLYKYYYDEHGRYYRTKFEVLYTLSKNNIIVLDAYSTPGKGVINYLKHK